MYSGPATSRHDGDGRVAGDTATAGDGTADAEQRAATAAQSQWSAGGWATQRRPLPAADDEKDKSAVHTTKATTTGNEDGRSSADSDGKETHGSFCADFQIKAAPSIMTVAQMQ